MLAKLLGLTLSTKGAKCEESATSKPYVARISRQDEALAERQRVQSERKYLTEDEVKALLVGAGAGRHAVRDRAILGFLYYHAMRASELCGLRMGDLDLKAGRVYVRRCKGSLSTTQPINGPLLRAVGRWLKERPETPHKEVFINERGEPLSRFALNYLVKVWGERGGLAIPVHPHMLRHACGYALVNRPGGSKDLRLIQDYLGHRDPRHTTIYAALASERFEDLWGEV